MTVSEKLAFEILRIEMWHIASLLYAYMVTEACVVLWIVSKIFKTVSPDIDTRWFFIVTQYLGVTFLSGSLLTFSLLYSRKKKLKPIHLALIFALCLANFLLVATNPVHMLFYNKYTFYSDSFGPLFFYSTGLSYAYIAVSVVLLGKNFIKMFGAERRKAILFSVAIMIPVIINVFYVADLFETLLHYQPLFDYTPIAINASLILFAIAAFRFRFLDVLPIAGQSVFNGLGDPAAVYGADARVIAANEKFSMLTKQGFSADGCQYRDGEEIVFLNKTYRVKLSPIHKHRSLLRLAGVTEINALVDAAKVKNAQLSAANDRLNRLLYKKRELAAIRIRGSLLQEMHDIMGHSAVLALSYCEREAVRGYSSYDVALSKIKEYISSGSVEFQETVRDEDAPKKASYLAQEAGRIIEESGFTTSLTLQGDKRELLPETAAAVLSVLREAVTNAVKYSGAVTFDVVMRFDADAFSLFILDNGKGCDNITPGAGLVGMKNKIAARSGIIECSSFAGGGFRIVAKIPGGSAYAV